MHELIVFLDSGDTLIDEATQVYEGGQIIRADFVAGGREFLLALHREGFTTALVADGKQQDFLNVYYDPSLKLCFDAWVVSEVVGMQKPNRIMFETAMVQLGLTEEDKKRIVMIGNNIRKDIRGANEFGITSIWFDWSPRYFHTIEHPDEQPNYRVVSIGQLQQLLYELDGKASRGEPLC
ncbi:MAG: HAD family hydrolase [Sphaerochaetaceae bacterium]